MQMSLKKIIMIPILLGLTVFIIKYIVNNAHNNIDKSNSNNSNINFYKYLLCINGMNKDNELISN